MANTVVKVTDITDEELDDSLLLLVGEDGTVTPDQDTVETYLKQRNGPTNVQIMKFNRTEKQGIDITVDNVTFIPDAVSEEIVKCDMDEVARNLYNFRLDHDYTPLTSPRRDSSPLEEDDELARTLSLLDGPNPGQLLSSMDLSEPPPLIMTSSKSKQPARVNLIQSITIQPPAVNHNAALATPQLKPEGLFSPQPQEEYNKTSDEESEEPEMPTLEPIIHPIPKRETPLPKLVTLPRAKMKTVKEQKTPKLKTIKPKTKPEKVKEILEEESDDNDEEEENYMEDDKYNSSDSDADDSDFDIEEELKPKTLKRPGRKPVKPEMTKPVKTPRRRGRTKEATKKEIVKEEVKEEKSPEKKEEVAKEETKEPEKEKQEQAGVKVVEKKPVKKEKKTPKPILDDFLLFSTPDIIRRVGGKEPLTPVTPEVPTPGKPVKIGQEQQRKSLDQSQNKPRKSLDEKDKEKDKDRHDKSKDNKERRASTTSIDSKVKRLSIDEKSKTKESKPERRTSDTKKPDRRKSQDSATANTDISSDDLQSNVLNEESKSFSMDTTLNTSANTSLDSSNMNLDTTGLDLDPALLDNLNNDEISEDILYQVAQSLVSNPELQNAIDKGINEGVLDPMAVDSVVSSPSVVHSAATDLVIQGATQIVRPDGRVVIIPPIERPTTRSRNKKTEEVKPVFKPIHKPLDDDHVSGNELDSSNDEEEESEDDPNKLWCICNQPHNNRFMICCDTCEEWYHGKCVNITKSMGQQMEAEGREWICLFCKDPSLKRPQAAARRVRKASRNSRTSTDSASSSVKKVESTPAIPCVVCQKPARTNSIYCSEACILTHAQGIERVVVFERTTGRMLTGNKAPSAANLDQWLKDHPGYQVVRSGGKIVTAKAGNLVQAANLAQTKLKLVKNANNHGVSLAIQKKTGSNLGVLKHSPKEVQTQQVKSALKASLLSQKGALNKTQSPKEPPKSRLSTESLKSPSVSTPSKTPKLVQSTIPKISKISTEKVLKSPTVNKEKPPAIKERTLSTSSKEKTVVRTPKPKKEKEKEKEETTPQKQPENIRENVQKTILEQLTNRLKGVDDLKLNEDEVKSISTEVESQLFKCFGDTGQKYRNKYRSLIFNIKDVKNQTLWRRICEKSINPYELVRLSTDDMANQELAQWREKEAKHQLDMIKKSELELLNCNRQYVLKTHKGEQVVEDDHGNKVDNTEVIKSLTEGSSLDSGEPKRDSSKERDKKNSSKHSHKDKDRDRDRKNSKDKEYRSHRSSSRDKDKERSRKRSKSRDRKHGDRKKRSRSKERDRSRHRKSHKSSRHKRDDISSTDKLDKKSKEILELLVDSKIVAPLEDRLWKHVPQEDIVPGKANESDSDHEPTSTVTIPTPPRIPEVEDEKNLPISPEKEKETLEFPRSMSPPPVTRPTEIWRGIINMIDVAEISITAHEVSGDCTGLNKELSSHLDIVGRISPDTVWDYIGKMKCSNSKGISLIRLNATNMEEKMPYLALYSYLSSRDRLGVVKSLNKAVKDFYIYPLAPQKPIPQVLLPLNGPGFEESRPALLLGIIVRDKRKRPYLEPSVPVVMKKTRVETPPLPIVPPPTLPPPPPPPRSYTPPPAPVKDPRLNKTPAPVPAVRLPTPIAPIAPIIPPVVDNTATLPAAPEDPSVITVGDNTPPAPGSEDEPYSPGDSSDSSVIEITPLPKPASTVPTSSSLNPAAPSTAFPEIPGLGGNLPSTPLEMQRQIEELTKKIEMRKSEIVSMSQTIVSAASTEIGTTDLANIALPTNLQQILDSIKSIGDTTEVPSPPPPAKDISQTDLTIPLMIPKRNTRPLNSNPPPPPLQKSDLPSDTIPLKLPNKPLIKPHSMNSPILDDRPSVLSSLTEEDLIKKAAEMLGEEQPVVVKDKDVRVPPPSIVHPVAKRPKIEVSLPPVPGLEDEDT